LLHNLIRDPLNIGYANCNTVFDLYMETFAPNADHKSDAATIVLFLDGCKSDTEVEVKYRYKFKMFGVSLSKANPVKEFGAVYLWEKGRNVQNWYSSISNNGLAADGGVGVVRARVRKGDAVPVLMLSHYIRIPSGYTDVTTFFKGEIINESIKELK